MPNLSPHNLHRNGAALFSQGSIDDWTILDDLYRHGDIDAAALALGVAWQQLSPPDQNQVVKLVRQLLTRTDSEK